MESKDPNGSFPPSSEKSSTEAELLLEHCIDRLNAGEPLDLERILREHPDIGPEVVLQLQVFEGFEDDLEIALPLDTFGDYTLRRKLGRGGMGVVYDAWQGSLDRQVALKVLPVGIAADDKAFHRFMREAKTTAKLNHANIVGVHGVGIEQNTPYYAMEYVQGKTLAQILVKLDVAEPSFLTPFGSREELAFYSNVARCFADVADGLQYAHSRGVIHRDIKPSNLILDAEGRLRILDFGLAHIEGQESLTISGAFVGTPLYMSPEQARQRKVKVDHRTDIYSLGATMYELLTCRPPFKGKDHQETLSQIIEWDPVEPRKLSSRIPRDLETIVLKCLRKDPMDRYGTAEALGQDLRRFVRGDPVEARQQMALEKLARRVRRNKWKLIGAVAILILLSSVAFLIWTNYRQSHEMGLANFNSKVLEAVAKLHRWKLTYGAKPGEFLNIDPQYLFLPGDVRSSTMELDSNPLSEALSDLSEAIQICPGEAEPYYYRARILHLQGHVDAARHEVKQSLDRDRDFVPALILQADLTDKDDLVPRVSQRRSWDEQGTKSWTGVWLSAYQAMKREHWEEAGQAYGKLLRWIERHGEPYVGASIELYLGRGIARLEDRYFQGAIRDFCAVSNRWPRFLEPALLLGKTYYLQGDREEAQNWFRRLYSQSSSSPEAALWISATYYSLGDYKRGLEWADELDASIKDRVGAAFLLRLYRMEEAVERSRKAIGQNPDDPIAQVVLAASILGTLTDRFDSKRDVKFSEANKACKKAIELSTKLKLSKGVRSYMYTILAALFREQRRFEDAIEACETALELSGEDARAYRELGVIRRRQGYPKKSELLLRRAIELDGEVEYVHLSLANALRLQGRYKEAIAEYEEAIRLEPDNAGRRINLGLCYLEIGRYEEASQQFENARDLLPRGRFSHAELALALWKQGRLAEAFQVAAKGTLCDRDIPQCFFILGLVLESQGNLDDAINSHCQALILNPGLTGSHKKLAKLLLIQRGKQVAVKDMDSLVEVLEKSAEAEEAEPQLLNSLSLVLLQETARKDLTKALKYASRAVEKTERQDAGMLATLAVILFSAGEEAKAVLALEEAVRLPNATRLQGELLEEYRRKIHPELVSYASIDSALDGGDPEPTMDGSGSEKLSIYFQGRLYQQEGKHREALKMFQKLVLLDKDHYEPHLRFAESLFASETARDAERYLRGILNEGFLDDAELWHSWIVLCLGDLKLSPEQILLDFPGREPPSTSQAKSDIRWLLEQLQQKGGISINCGGNECSGFGKDHFFYGGKKRLQPFGDEIHGTQDADIYRLVRRFPDDQLFSGYRVPLWKGVYRITLHFAEIVFMVPDRRRFDVLIENETVLSDYEPYAAGFSTADSHAFTTEVNDGILDIEFRRKISNPMISAIQVQRLE